LTLQDPQKKGETGTETEIYGSAIKCASRENFTFATDLSVQNSATNEEGKEGRKEGRKEGTKKGRTGRKRESGEAQWVS